MVGWEYQRIGNPVYSVQNHAEQVNNAIAAQADAIATSLESVGLVQPFERGLDQGIAMIITDQGIQEEADALGLHIINQDEFNAGIINGTQAATFAHDLTGKTRASSCSATAIPARPRSTSARTAASSASSSTTPPTARPTVRGLPGQQLRRADRIDPEVDRADRPEGRRPGRGDRHRQSQPDRPGAEGARHRARHHRGRLDRHPARASAADRGRWVQWGIDQQFYVMGFMCAAGAWVQLERGYPYLDIRTGGEVVRDKDLERVEARTEIWLARRANTASRGWSGRRRATSGLAAAPFAKRADDDGRRGLAAYLQAPRVSARSGLGLRPRARTTSTSTCSRARCWRSSATTAPASRP